MVRTLPVLFVMVLFLVSCSTEAAQLIPSPDRESLIPTGQIKINPEIDVYPVVSLSTEYQDPVPLPYPVNTAGAEDSAFMMPDGKTLYVWFTPDVNNPVENQALDRVTGIYVFHLEEGSWSPAERVYLSEPDLATLDGCEFVLGEWMWFCTAREGYTGLHWFTARQVEGVWTDWQLADFDPAFEVGELHITADGQELYFHSSRSGGKGEYDIWVSKLVNGGWGEPANVSAVNSAYPDGWPYLSQDGTEMWITRSIGAPELWRSLRVEGEWTEPVKMFSAFSGEASLDNHGNVYFTHHYFKDNQMLEADIFVAYRK